MKIHSLLRATLLVASLSAAGLAVARSSNMVELGRQTVSASAKPLTADAMRQAIIAGGAVHRWKPINDQPGVVTLETDSGPHQVIVDVAYDPQGWQITYKNSSNMNYEHTDKKTSIHPKYNKWVEELNADIGRAAADAQASAH